MGKYSQCGSSYVQELKLKWPVLVYVEPNCAFTLTEIMMFVYFESVEDIHRSITVVL